MQPFDVYCIYVIETNSQRLAMKKALSIFATLIATIVLVILIAFALFLFVQSKHDSNSNIQNQNTTIGVLATVLD